MNLDLLLLRLDDSADRARRRVGDALGGTPWTVALATLLTFGLALTGWASARDAKARRASPAHVVEEQIAAAEHHDPSAYAATWDDPHDHEAPDPRWHYDLLPPRVLRVEADRAWLGVVVRKSAATEESASLQSGVWELVRRGDAWKVHALHDVTERPLPSAHDLRSAATDDAR